MINKIFDLFEKKEVREKSIWFHPGTYKFYFPYTSFTFVPDEQGYSSVYTCVVEMFVGLENDMQEGKLATIIVKSDDEGIGITNFFEDIASKIRLSFFDKVFHDDILKGEPSQLEERIRWLEYYSSLYYPSAFPHGTLREVRMKWDNIEKRYTHPEWYEYTGVHQYDLRADSSPSKGDIYLAEYNRGKYPRLGDLEKVMVLKVNDTLKTILVAPITDYKYRNLKSEKESIIIGENDLGINTYESVIIEKVSTINFENLNKKIGEVSKNKLNEVILALKKTF